MRLIDADAFAEFLKDAVKRQKYENTKIDRLLTVADVIEAVISELEGTSLDGFENAPTIEPEQNIIRCKDCKYFHYDKPYVVYDIPVLGHEVCDKWGDGCKTSENGFCFMEERRGEQE